jgi:hypothetical protein
MGFRRVFATATILAGCLAMPGHAANAPAQTPMAQTPVAQTPIAKIPVTLGFANLAGEDLAGLAAEDAAALAPLFQRVRIVGPHQIPNSQVLFVYAHLNPDGTLQDTPGSGVRQIVQVTHAAILVLASPNTSTNIDNAAALAGPRTANLVFTIDRRDGGFDRFFRKLFERMRSGEDMVSAWTQLTAAEPRYTPPDAPRAIFLAEKGKIVFPPSQPTNTQSSAQPSAAAAPAP